MASCDEREVWCLGQLSALCGVHELTLSWWPVSRVIDPIGAGDAFDAGFLSAFLEEPSVNGIPENCLPDVLKEALERANWMGALATQFKGDWEGLPTLAELERIRAGMAEITR